MAATAIDLSAIKPDSLYPPKEAAPVLNKTEKTLANLRCARTGPAFHRVGGSPFYRGADLLKYIEDSRVESGPPPKAPGRAQRAA